MTNFEFAVEILKYFDLAAEAKQLRSAILKRYKNMMNSINRRGLYAAMFFLMLSCGKEELECDPLFDPNCSSASDQSNPETSISDPSVDASSVSISWEGGIAFSQFSYRLLPLSYDNPVSLYLDWSDWSSDTTVTLDPLDEGEYDFYVKSRFGDTEEAAPDLVSFTIDAIVGTGLRIYPLRQQVTLEGNDDGSQTVDIFLYAENIESFLGAEIELQFSNDILPINFHFKVDIFLTINLMIICSLAVHFQLSI